MRRATPNSHSFFKSFGDFYPRSPCGERLLRYSEQSAPPNISIHALLAESDLRVVDGSKSSIISIHALLAESDSAAALLWGGIMSFLSTLSLRRATTRPCMRRTVEPDFYPRSPCGERPVIRFVQLCQGDFYPRSPCGERPDGSICLDSRLLFLSTLSLRRATW